MRGENFTRIGLSLFCIGLITSYLWVIMYDRESDIIVNGKISPQGSESKALLTASVAFTSIGYGLCIAGFAISSDIMKFSLKMPKNNLIET